jgi:hypothetical protein
MHNIISFPAKIVTLVFDHWPLIFVLVILLTALAKLSVLCKHDKPQRHLNKEYHAGVKACGRIISFIDDRMQIDRNIDALSYLKGQYTRLQQELDQHMQLDIDPGSLTQYYLQNYNDTSSQLYQEMRNLEQIIYRNTTQQ